MFLQNAVYVWGHHTVSEMWSGQSQSGWTSSYACEIMHWCFIFFPLSAPQFPVWWPLQSYQGKTKTPTWTLPSPLLALPLPPLWIQRPLSHQMYLPWRRWKCNETPPSGKVSVTAVRTSLPPSISSIFRFKFVILFLFSLKCMYKRTIQHEACLSIMLIYI